MKKLHNIDPVFDENSEILILGSFPSPKSRSAGFYYAHPQNRFWCVISSVYGCDEPHTTEEKKDFLLGHKIALFGTPSLHVRSRGLRIRAYAARCRTIFRSYSRTAA